jgi:hypothetical protein
VRPERQEEMAARLPGPATVIRVESGHLYPVTHPAAFAAVVTATAPPAP